MHGRACVGLRHDDRVGLAGLTQFVRDEALQRTRRHRAIDRTQYAESGLRRGFEHFVVVLLDDVVFTVAEESEVILGSPAQELLRLVDTLGIERQPPLAELLGHVAHLLPHRRPVVYAQFHIVQRRGDRFVQLFKAPQFRELVDLDVHDRLGLALVRVVEPEIQQVTARVAGYEIHGMDHRVQQDLRQLRRNANRIDEERHVVRGDLNDRVARLPAFVLDTRVEHAHGRCTALAHADEIEQSADQRRPAGRRAHDEVVVQYALEELADEDLRLRALRGRQVGLQFGEDRVDQGVRGFEFRVHDQVCSCFAAAAPDEPQIIRRIHCAPAAGTIRR